MLYNIQTPNNIDQLTGHITHLRPDCNCQVHHKMRKEPQLKLPFVLAQELYRKEALLLNFSPSSLLSGSFYQHILSEVHTIIAR